MKLAVIRRGALAALVSTACAHGEARKLERASKELGRAVARAQEAKIRDAAVPSARATVDTEAMTRGGNRKAWARALSRPERVESEATVLITSDLPVRMVWSESGWRLAEDPTDLYAQQTPRQALRALVLASRFNRWDVLVGLAPKRYRMGLSERDLEKAWTQGEHAAVLRAARDELARHLTDPIVADAHEAVLDMGGGHVARLEREGDRWVVVDFLPPTPSP